MGFFPTLGNFTGKNTIALLAFLAKLKYTFDNCGVSEGKTVCVLACLLSNGAEEVYEAYFTDGISTDPHVYHGTFPVVINVPIQGFLNKNVLEKKHDFVTRAFQRPDGDELGLEIRFSKATRQCRHFLKLEEK